MAKRATAHQRGYGRRWRKARAAFLNLNPLCAFHQRKGRAVRATIVDHITPHKGDDRLFWDTANWQALCKRCHDSVKQSEERRGYATDIGADGWPVDPKHPANGGGGGSASHGMNRGPAGVPHKT